MNKYRILILVGLMAFVGFTLQAQALYNEGLMFVGGTQSSPGLFIQGNFKAGGNSQINHPGKTILTGNFINNVTSGTVFKESNRGGIFEFKGNTAQTISNMTSASKANNPVKFPNTVIINNTASDAKVTLEAGSSASVMNVTFTNGRLVLNSISSGTNESQIAHLMLEDGGSTIANTGIDDNIQVNLDLGRAGALIGFTPPFETMYADYFFYNFLSIPSETELFKGNSNELWNTDPLRPLNGGTGYILGQVLVPYARTDYYLNKLHADYGNGTSTGALFSEMRTQDFEFGRHHIPSSFGQYLAAKSTITDGFSGEKLIKDNVKVKLTTGYNYLGNPFMVPLDLTDLFGNNRSTWGINTDKVEKNFWVLAKGSSGIGTVSGSGSNIYANFVFTATYLLAQTTGGTNYQDTRGDNLIAPMQMFVLKNNGPSLDDFFIPKSKRTHGNTNFLRSIENEPIDELLIETKDKEAGGFDRLCVVFRNNASLEATDEYDTEKLFNRSGGVNQIYTRSTDNKLLTSNVINPETNKLQMYFEPAIDPQEVELTAYRLNSLQSVAQVVLEDTKTGTKADLTQTPSYTFQSYPADKIDRFILHFSASPISIEDLVGESVPTAYYSDNTTYVHGLQNEEIGNDIMIYNMQGQLLYQQKVTDISPCSLPKQLSTGIYMIKVKGNPHVMKLHVR